MSKWDKIEEYCVTGFFAMIVLTVIYIIIWLVPVYIWIILLVLVIGLFILGLLCYILGRILHYFMDKIDNADFKSREKPKDRNWLGRRGDESDEDV